MSDTPQSSSLVQNLNEHPDEHEVFAVVVDGDVALLIPCHKTQNEMQIAIWSSDPKIVKVNENVKTTIRPGWFWDGTEFTETQ